MKTSHNLRDSEEAQQILQQGLWLQRVQIPAAATVRPALRWSLELVSSGQPLPPIGFVVDLGHAALGTDWESRENRDMPPLPGLPPGLLPPTRIMCWANCTPTGPLLGPAMSSAFIRIRNRCAARRGLAFVLTRFAARADFTGVALSPGVIKGLLEQAPRMCSLGAGMHLAETAFILCWRNCTSR